MEGNNLVYTLVVSVFLCVLCTVSTADMEPQCITMFEWIFDDTCTKNWRCVWKDPMRMLDCKPGSVYSLNTLTCVHKDGPYDDCNQSPCAKQPCQNGGQCFFGRFSNQYQCQCPYNYGGRHCERELTSLQEICREHPEAIIPDPHECQLYYNCSHFYQYVPRFFVQHMQECTYLQLFDPVKRTCANFTEVQCGNRTNPKEWCKYRRALCGSAHCIPCYINSPSCRGLSDGMYPHGSKVGAPLYMICQQEYTVKTGQCPKDDQGRPLFVGNDGNCSSPVYVPPPTPLPSG